MARPGRSRASSAWRRERGNEASWSGLRAACVVGAVAPDSVLRPALMQTAATNRCGELAAVLAPILEPACASVRRHTDALRGCLRLHGGWIDLRSAAPCSLRKHCHHRPVNACGRRWLAWSRPSRDVGPPSLRTQRSLIASLSAITSGSSSSITGNPSTSSRPRNQVPWRLANCRDRTWTRSIVSASVPWPASMAMTSR